jgi:glucose/arabinose dehydrogenase
MPNCMRRLVLLAVAAVAAVAYAAQPAAAQRLVQFPGPSQGFNQPFYVTGEPGNPSRIYVVEGAGRIRLVSNGTTQATPFLDINAEVWDRSAAEGSCECGMFSMAFAPDYATSGLLYVFFTRDVPDPGVHELVIKEFRRMADPDNIDEVGTGRDVLVIRHPNADNHNGGQLQFGPDGLLYISTGDGGGGQAANGQLTTTMLGKILRINPADPPGIPTYSIPAGNPFVDGPGGKADEIYSYGLRNPYRFSFDRLTGDLAIGDVGEVSREEIDFVPNGGGLGANFGWACFEGTQATGQCASLPANHTPPVLEYTRAGFTAAVNGGYVVRDQTLPSLLGRYLYADTFNALSNRIFSAQLFPGGSSGNAPTGLTANFVVSFGEDACGHIYVAHGNTVSRIQQTSGAPACQPQTVLLPPPQVQGDTRGPGLSVDASKGRRAGARGEVILLVGCDEACAVQGDGAVVLPGKDIGLDQASVSLAAGIPGALRLDLSGKEARRLRAALLDHEKAKAKVELTAADAVGNVSAAERKIKQKR